MDLLASDRQRFLASLLGDLSSLSKCSLSLARGTLEPDHVSIHVVSFSQPCLRREEARVIDSSLAVAYEIRTTIADAVNTFTVR